MFIVLLFCKIIISSNSQNADEPSLPRLILTSVRFLPYVQDGAGLSEKMIEIIQACPTDVQREIISSLPEILEDQQHELIAPSLKDMLDETRTLTCTILDTLSNMSLSKAVMKELLDIVLKRLYRVALSDLPSVVDFVLCSNQPDEDIINIVQVNI